MEISTACCGLPHLNAVPPSLPKEDHHGMTESSIPFQTPLFPSEQAPIVSIVKEKKIELASQFVDSVTKLNNAEKCELDVQVSLSPINENGPGNEITPEKSTPLTSQCHGNKDKTKYDFDSVPLFRRDFVQAEFGNSVIWIPQNREEWDECSGELTGLCATAAQRRARALRRNCPTLLPEIYIRDRIDIDDPLRGFQIRHKTGGWLQGFILTTTFTTWTHYFRWDSRHPKSGMSPTPVPNLKSKWDDGTLSTELEAQPRAGDPVGGVVWSTVAEISLLGGIGCGEYLLRMALDDISRQGCYKYVVLQATDFSRPFYEKFGFKRVGCVTRYGTHPHLVGYRHWAYADEKNLNAHGGPSYMMGMRVQDANIKSPHDEKLSILDYVTNFLVKEKPKISLELSSNPQEPLNFRTSSSKKRKLDKTKISDDESKLIRVVSYCTEMEKVNMETSVNNKAINFSDFPIVKKAKPTKDIDKMTLMVTQQKQKRKPPRPRETSNISQNKLVITSKQLSTTNIMAPTDHYCLRKQKFTISQRVRNKPIFYNKVVARKNVLRTSGSFYFVIHFDAEGETLRLVKLEQRGTFFKGKREGRVKWKAILDEKKGISCGDMKYDFTVPSSEWEIVQSVMVTKTTIVADESWDIIESNIIMQ